MSDTDDLDVEELEAGDSVYSRLVITTKDLKRYQKIVDEWKEDPTGIYKWADDLSKMSLLVLEHIIKNAKGRSGPYHQLKAIDTVARLLEAIAKVDNAKSNLQRGEGSAVRPVGEPGDGPDRTTGREEQSGGRKTSTVRERIEAGEYVAVVDSERPNHGPGSSENEGRVEQGESNPAVPGLGIPQSHSRAYERVQVRDNREVPSDDNLDGLLPDDFT
jgi:hypothetical protein